MYSCGRLNQPCQDMPHLRFVSTDTLQLLSRSESRQSAPVLSRKFAVRHPFERSNYCFIEAAVHSKSGVPQSVLETSHSDAGIFVHERQAHHRQSLRRNRFVRHLRGPYKVAGLLEHAQDLDRQGYAIIPHDGSPQLSSKRNGIVITLGLQARIPMLPSRLWVGPFSQSRSKG